MSGSKRACVLVLMPSPRTKHLISILPRDISSKYQFILYYKPKGLGFPNLQDYLEDLKEFVTEQQIDIVVTHMDCGTLLRAALAREFPHLRGPSVESVFLAMNKYYTRCFLDPQPIPFACLDLAAPDIDHACTEVLQKVGTPAFFKPSCLSSSRGIASITNAQELKKFAQSYVCSEHFTAEAMDANFVNPFLTKNIDEQKYPLASQTTAIVEKHMGDVSIINADGYVFEGKIFHWSISDNLYSKSKPCYSFGAAHPTTLPESTQQNIWSTYDAVVGKMIEFGYANDFVNLEVFLLDSGEVKLMEVNQRIGGNLFASREVFTNGDIISAQLKLGQGKNPGRPTPNGRHALRCYIGTFGSGKANQLYDYSCTLSGLHPDMDPDHEIDGSAGEGGAILCRAVLSGASRGEVMEKYRALCMRVLLRPEFSVFDWL